MIDDQKGLILKQQQQMDEIKKQNEAMKQQIEVLMQKMK